MPGTLGANWNEGQAHLQGNICTQDGSKLQEQLKNQKTHPVLMP